MPSAAARPSAAPSGTRPRTAARAPRLSLRTRVAAAAGRLALFVLRVLGRGATTTPGRVALALDRRLPRRLAAALPHGVTLVTGTNGKTTTAAMLAAVLEERGWRLAHNRGGANLRTGITTALLARPRADAALLEVDEATMPFAGGLRPRLALVTNFFRDQLDRYGELHTAVARVRRGLEALPPQAAVVLNADDPLAASVARGTHLRVVHFGMDSAAAPGPSEPVPSASGAPDTGLDPVSAAAPGPAPEDPGPAADPPAAAAPSPGQPGAGHLPFADPAASADAPSDAPRCPECGAELTYAFRLYAHLGHYHCSACAYARPVPDVRIAAWRPGGPHQRGMLRLETPAGPIEVGLQLPGLYNAYNAAAAVAAALALDTDPADAARALGGFRHAFGRMEWLTLEGHPACLVLVKNPAGCSLALRAALADPAPGKSLVLVLNDRTADGTDVSWIWDADFEALTAADPGVAAVFASGRRAADMALRLKYAGLPTDRLTVVDAPMAAAHAAARAAAPGAPVYVLPTYTAMLELRAALARRGLLPPFWEV